MSQAPSIATTFHKLFGGLVTAESETGGTFQSTDEFLNPVTGQSELMVWPMVLANFLFVPERELSKAPTSILAFAHRLARLQPDTAVNLPPDTVRGEQIGYTINEALTGDDQLEDWR